jgi:S-DNA-T family DNA segregation ATPase FtsK/SpoIIIE
MDRRYNLLGANGVRSIGEFNERLEEGRTLRRREPRGPEEDPDRWLYTDGVLPYIVVVVDELADLMMTVQSEVEKPLTHLAQKARAIGIHLIVATQRPSVNVITGLIKANFPSRIAFRVSSKTDSRTILDQNGADALLGNGDMLFLPPGSSEPIRIQGAYISTPETDRMMAWYREQTELRNAALDEKDAHQEADVLEQVRIYESESGSDSALNAGGSSDWDDLFRAAAEVCVHQDQGSTSLLQRRLKVGYGRAARIVDQLHDAGILGPSEGSKAREVLVGLDELNAICSSHGM